MGRVTLLPVSRRQKPKKGSHYGIHHKICLSPYLLIVLQRSIIIAFKTRAWIRHTFLA